MSVTEAFTYKNIDGELVHLDAPLLINCGCGTHYAEGWLNTDTRTNEDTHPDLIVTVADPLPFPNCSAGRIYLGHVLEHVVWNDAERFLFDVHRTLDRGGELLITGPDTYRTLEQWRDGQLPWLLVQSVLEHAQVPSTTDWPEASHQWNCREDRVVELLLATGFVDIEPHTDPPAGWPVVNWASWQCCVSARRAL